MSLPARVKLISVGPSIMSSYNGRTSKKPLALVDLNDQIGTCPEPMAWALLSLMQAVKMSGGVLRITDLHRSPAKSAAARVKYERWLADGKPRGREYDKSIHKNAYISPAGKSWHNAARAIDVDLKSLEFDVPEDQWLDVLWSLASPLGFEPIIGRPDEDATEAWHFDFRGPWEHVEERLGNGAGAMCACLDIGVGEGIYSEPEARQLQAQLHRCGQDVGKVDGDIGRKTRAGLSGLGLSPSIRHAQALFDLPTRGY